MDRRTSTTAALRRLAVGVLVGPALVLLWLLLGSGPAHAVLATEDGSGLDGVAGSLTGDAAARNPGAASRAPDAVSTTVQKTLDAARKATPDQLTTVVDKAISPVAEPAVTKTVDVVEETVRTTAGDRVAEPVADVTAVVQATVKTVTNTVTSPPGGDGEPPDAPVAPGDDSVTPGPESPAGADDSRSGERGKPGRDREAAPSSQTVQPPSPAPAADLAARLLGQDLSGAVSPDAAFGAAVADAASRAEVADRTVAWRPAHVGLVGPGAPAAGESSSSGSSGPITQLAGPVSTILLSPPAASTAAAGESWALPSGPYFSPGSSPD